MGPKVNEVTGKVAAALCTPKVREVRDKATATCTSTGLMINEASCKATATCTDTVVPKFKELGIKASEICAQTVVPKLKELTNTGVSKAQGDQWQSCSCHLHSKGQGSQW